MRAAAGWAGVGLVLLAAAWAALGGYDPVLDVDAARANLGPSLAHPLGFDRLGRDVARRTAAATHAFLGPGLVGLGVCGALALVPGVVAGALGGRAARAALLPHAATGAVPRFVLVVLFVALVGHSPALLGAAAGLAYAPTLAEALAARVESLRATGWVTATRAHGVGWPGLLLRDLAAGACRPVLAEHALRFLAFLLTVESTLAFLGHFGVQEPAPSWGNLLAFSLGHAGNPWAWAGPVLALWLTLVSLQGAAERLRWDHA